MDKHLIVMILIVAIPVTLLISFSIINTHNSYIFTKNLYSDYSCEKLQQKIIQINKLNEGKIIKDTSDRAVFEELMMEKNCDV